MSNFFFQNITNLLIFTGDYFPIVNCSVICPWNNVLQGNSVYAFESCFQLMILNLILTYKELRHFEAANSFQVLNKKMHKVKLGLLYWKTRNLSKSKSHVKRTRKQVNSVSTDKRWRISVHENKQQVLLIETLNVQKSMNSLWHFKTSLSIEIDIDRHSTKKA